MGEEPLVNKRRHDAIAAQIAYTATVAKSTYPTDQVVLDAANEVVRTQARYVLALLGSKGQPGELDG